MARHRTMPPSFVHNDILCPLISMHHPRRLAITILLQTSPPAELFLMGRDTRQVYYTTQQSTTTTPLSPCPNAYNKISICCSNSLQLPRFSCPLPINNQDCARKSNPPDISQMTTTTLQRSANRVSARVSHPSA